MFKIGDLVKVKEDAKSLYGLGFNADMYKYRGKVFEISDVNVRDQKDWYYLEGCNHKYGRWIFAESWLELVQLNDFSIEEKEIEKLFT